MVLRFHRYSIVARWTSSYIGKCGRCGVVRMPAVSPGGHMHPSARAARLGVAIGAVFAFVGHAGLAAAQRWGAIAGTVTDTAGVPLFGADVFVDGTAIRVATDGRGTFHVMGVPTGTLVVSVRRLGFVPRSVKVEVGAVGSATVSLRLPALVQALAPVVVRTNRMNYTGRLAGYYERLERRAGGYFVTREQIESENPRMMSHLLQRAPGLTIVRGRAGITGVRMRGRTCWPMVWLDDTPMPAGEVDIDSFTPHSLEGIELYLGGTTPPLRYTWVRNMSSCGTILLWSRSTERHRPRDRGGASPELEALVSSGAVFTADQVDTAARPLPERPLDVDYPESLFAEGIGGLVVAEFVVDAHGRVETDTYGVVSSTHPLFSDAVRQALGRATFAPAVRGGEVVRQLMHQPFTFVPAARERAPRRASADRPARPR
jgi:TonB family protein